MPAKEFSANAATGSDNTVIGPSILISGKLTGDEDLTIRAFVRDAELRTQARCVGYRGEGQWKHHEE